MASTSPVPSRAALNALRGVLFTTSCSVIILAEERRRRLKIARAAIDNAKKLHTVRVNRGPIALSEGWEDRLSELEDEVLSLSPAPQRKNPYRRRRRDPSTYMFLQDGELDIHNHSPNVELNHATQESPNTQQTQTPGSGPDTRKRHPAPTSSHRHYDLFQALSVSNATGLGSISTVTSNYIRLEGRNAGQVEPQSTLPFMDRPLSTADTLSAQKSHIIGLDSFTSSRLSLSSISPHFASSRPGWYDAAANLEQLLERLDASGAGESERLEALNEAILILQNLGSLRSSSPKLVSVMIRHGMKVLQNTVELDLSKTNTVLSMLLLKCREPLEIIFPLVRWLEGKRHNKALEKLLDFLTSQEQSRSWRRGMTLYRLLQQSESLGFKKTKSLYKLLNTAGLYDRITLASDTEYRIRRLMISKALRDGDYGFAQDEIKALAKLDPDAFNADVKLQSRLIVRQAALGDWECVRRGVENLIEVANVKTTEIQSMLGKITETFAQTSPPDSLEFLIRRFVSDYGINLRPRWVNLVLDYYAGRHDLDSMFSWLHFCVDRGFKVDDSFIRRFYSGCRKYWSFSDKTISTLHQSLQEAMPSILSLSDDMQMKIRVAQPFAPLNPNDWTSESSAFECMKSLATRGEWGTVCSAYVQYSSCNLGFSDRCLRLAVIGHLKNKDASIDQAALLIEEARAEGNTVTMALTPLLLARIEKGLDITGLVKQELRRGTRLHDSVYNKAAQMLSANGDLQGAASMCEIAARENGNGELLYSEYNFSNLIFAYTGSAHYKALQSILANFISEVQWWRGSPACKESIKLAMKTAAMRAVLHPQETNEHKDVLYKLDEALIHVKKCRATKGDRREVTEAFIRVVRPPVTDHKPEPEQISMGENQQLDGLFLERRDIEQADTPKHIYKHLWSVRQPLVARGEA